MTTQDKLADALSSAVIQMDMAGDCIEAGRYDEALLHVRSMMRNRREALAEHDAQPAPVLEKWEIDSMQTLADALEKRGDDLSTDSASWLRKYLVLAAAPQPALAAPDGVMGYMDPAATFLLPRTGECILSSHVVVVREPRDQYTLPIFLKPQPAPAPVQVGELSEVARVIDEGDGIWRPCSGCYETSDGHNVYGFPFSAVFRCNQGGGCNECGGIGVVWDDLDYAAMEDTAHTPAPAADGAGEYVEALLAMRSLFGEDRIPSPCAERDALDAAIAALRQPVPDAVRGLPGKYDSVLRPFFRLMERELHANAGKGDRPGWLAMSPAAAMLEIYYHAAKLQKAVKNGEGDAISEYAADVANMAMMMVDICGGLELESALASQQESRNAD